MTGIIINDSIVLVTTIDEYAAERGLLPSIIDGTADRLRPVMLTTLTTVLGLAPLLYEQSSQAQFLRPTVITLVYGLGFGMVLVLMLVPALLAIQYDVSRQVAAARRALRSRRAPGLRATTTLTALLLAAWLACTLGYAAVTGTLAAPLVQALPMLANLSAMTAGFLAFVTGTALLILIVYVVSAISFALRRKPA
jgi:predicted RND superfamily exporter protein